METAAAAAGGREDVGSPEEGEGFGGSRGHSGRRAARRGGELRWLPPPPQAGCSLAWNGEEPLL